MLRKAAVPMGNQLVADTLNFNESLGVFLWNPRNCIEEQMRRAGLVRLRILKVSRPI